MKFYNYSFFARLSIILVRILLCVLLTVLLMNFTTMIVRLVLPLLLLWQSVLNLRDFACPFVIDEKGITSKFPFRNILITWDEMGYIGVGERREGVGFSGERVYQLYFSKIPIKSVFFHSMTKLKIQSKEQFFLVYRKGLLEEILKYIDEPRIKGLERLKTSPNPYKRRRLGATMKEVGSDLHSATYHVAALGITCTLPESESFILPWNEAEHIGVLEYRPTIFAYRYYLYFSKIPLKKTYFHDHEERKLTPSNERVFIPYREGLLDEVLQYVDKSRIHKIERILNCPNPHEMQKSEKPRVLEMD